MSIAPPMFRRATFQRTRATSRRPNYGMTTWADLFTNRQLVGLTTFSDLVMEARSKVIDDGGSPAYADA